MPARKEKIVLPLIAVLLGFLLGSLIVILTGRSPVSMYAAIIKGFSGIDIINGQPINTRYIGEFIIQAMPIILTGLSFAFASRTGLFSIGAEGQLMMGSISATAVAILVQAPKVIHLPMVLLAAILGGALWGAIPGFLKARYNVHEVVVTIMMNYIALHFNNYMILNIFGSVDKVKTVPFPIPLCSSRHFWRA